MPDRETLNVYTIHDHPDDYPEHVIVTLDRVRGGVVDRDMRFLIQTPTIEAAREQIFALAPGSVCFPRQPDDQRHVVESWV